MRTNIDWRIEMSTQVASPACATFERIIKGLKKEKRELNARLHELSNQLEAAQGKRKPDAAAIKQLKAEISKANKRLETATADLGEMEVLFAERCGPE
jgi:peptidoglycan hydrolase CwlO-like protein